MLTPRTFCLRTQPPRCETKLCGGAACPSAFLWTTPTVSSLSSELTGSAAAAPAGAWVVWISSPTQPSDSSWAQHSTDWNPGDISENHPGEFSQHTEPWKIILSCCFLIPLWINSGVILFCLLFKGTSILSLVFFYSWDCKTEVIISNTSFFWSIHDRQIKLSSSGDFVNKWTKQSE